MVKNLISLEHDSAIKHVTGKAIYTDDIIEPKNLLHAAIGYSKISCGEIIKIDFTEVINSKGVIDIITEKDIEGRQVYSKNENLMDYRRMQITDTAKHRRTYMAKELTVEEEAKLEVQRNMWMKVYKEYMDDNCDEEGNVKDGILTEQQKRGLKKLSKRIKDGEIVVTKTDKSGRFFVSLMEDYTVKGMVHVGKDREITRKEVKEIERRLNGLAEIWIKCFQAGKDHGLTNEGRIRSGYKANAGVVPPLYTMEKDHKP